jgi:hypothetical protein
MTKEASSNDSRRKQQGESGPCPPRKSQSGEEIGIKRIAVLVGYLRLNLAGLLWSG